jgi:hypothetical protein
MKARFAREIKRAIVAGKYWKGRCNRSGYDVHYTPEIRVRELPTDQPFDFLPTDYDRLVDVQLCCRYCGTEPTADDKIENLIKGTPVYDTPSGELEPGCLYWNTWYPKGMYWDNQEGPHLMAILPNGDHWVIDGRAANCTMKNDRVHRCWIRHGDPETGNVHVDKKGHTCQAGGGSIASGSYHGFLHNGHFT